MDEKKPISRREMLRSKLGLGIAQSIGYAMGQAHGVTKHLEKTLRDPPPPTQPPPPEPEFPVFLRPPGAIEETAFTAQCTKCNQCIDACPPKTLVPLTGPYGKSFGTPVIDPALGGCAMCEDRPCAAACIESGVDIINDLIPMNMGHAVIHRSHCRSRIGEECSLCIDRCPIQHAIAHDWRKIPAVNKDICTGCGLCINSCPVDPGAISILPMKHRLPKPPTPHTHPKPAQPDQDQNAQGPSPD